MMRKKLKDIDVLEGLDDFWANAPIDIHTVSEDSIFWVESECPEGSIFYFSLEAASFAAEEFNQCKENILAEC